MASSRTSAAVGLQVGIFVLALGTAFIHLYLGLSFGNTLFVLNGIGYLGLLAALQLPIPQLTRFRGAARWALVGYAALAIAQIYEHVYRAHHAKLGGNGERAETAWPKACSVEHSRSYSTATLQDNVSKSYANRVQGRSSSHGPL